MIGETFWGNANKENDCESRHNLVGKQVDYVCRRKRNVEESNKPCKKKRIIAKTNLTCFMLYSFECCFIFFISFHFHIICCCKNEKEQRIVYYRVSKYWKTCCNVED
jgi:hypothetical protein